MTEQRIYVTAYQLPGKPDLIIAQHPRARFDVAFTYDEHRIAVPINDHELQDYRASGAVPIFYSIPNPF